MVKYFAKYAIKSLEWHVKSIYVKDVIKIVAKIVVLNL